MDNERNEIRELVWSSLYARLAGLLFFFSFTDAYEITSIETPRSAVFLVVFLVLLEWWCSFSSRERAYACRRFNAQSSQQLRELHRRYGQLLSLLDTIDLLHQDFAAMKRHVRTRRELLTMQNRCYRKRCMFVVLRQHYHFLRDVSSSYHGIDISCMLPPQIEFPNFPRLSV